MRWAYIKNGDVVSQLERVDADDAKDIDGGPDAFLVDFLTENKGQPIFLLSCGSRDESYQTDTIDARVKRVTGPALSNVKKLLLQLQLITSSFSEIKRFSPDRIICGRIGPLLWVCFVLSKLYSIPLIHSRHNSVDEHNSSWPRKLLMAIDSLLLKRIEGVICHGPYLKDQMINRAGVQPSKVVEFDVGYQSYLNSPEQSVDSKLPPNPNARYLFFIGRVSAIKGIFDLLDALEALLLKHSDIYLVVVGKGEHSSRLDQEVARRNLDDRVIRLGFCPTQEISSLLKQAHLLITPTRKEFPKGRCMVVMEGLVMGVPVIAPNYGPFPFLVKDDTNGILYEPNSTQQLQAGIDALLTDDKQYKRLAEGAHQSGQSLLEPELRFSQAANTLFDQLGA